MALLINHPHIPEEYITAEMVSRTTYKSLKDGYERNYFSVIKRGSIFYVVGYMCPDRTYRLAVKETKRLFPDLTYLYDIK